LHTAYFKPRLRKKKSHGFLPWLGMMGRRGHVAVDL
jgi:hypothetical protein